MATKQTPTVTVKTCPHCAKPLEAAKPTSERLRKGYVEAVKRTGAVWCAHCYGYMAPAHTCYTPVQWGRFRERMRLKGVKATHDRAFAAALVAIVLETESAQETQHV